MKAWVMYPILSIFVIFAIFSISVSIFALFYICSSFFACYMGGELEWEGISYISF